MTRDRTEVLGSSTFSTEDPRICPEFPWSYFTLHALPASSTILLWETIYGFPLLILCYSTPDFHLVVIDWLFLFSHLFILLFAMLFAILAPFQLSYKHSSKTFSAILPFVSLYSLCPEPVSPLSLSFTDGIYPANSTLFPYLVPVPWSVSKGADRSVAPISNIWSFTERAMS